MSRKLPFRRPRRRPLARPRPARRLRQAHRLLERGKHLEAANIFRDLARRAEDLNIRRAPLLYLQAGRARVLGNEVEAGLEELGRGFNMLAADGDQARLQAVAGRILAELGRLGHPELVGELSRRFGLPQDPATSSTISGGKENPLPAKCEHCGANLHPDEVEELKDGSVVCAYCGSRILFPGSEH